MSSHGDLYTHCNLLMTFQRKLGEPKESIDGHGPLYLCFAATFSVDITLKTRYYPTLFCVRFF